MAVQRGVYTCSIVGQACTLTPVANTESKPPLLAASTLVFNTVATTPPADFWSANFDYIVTVEAVTKTR